MYVNMNDNGRRQAKSGKGGSSKRNWLVLVYECFEIWMIAWVIRMQSIFDTKIKSKGTTYSTQKVKRKKTHTQKCSGVAQSRKDRTTSMRLKTWTNRFSTFLTLHSVSARVPPALSLRSMAKSSC